MLALTSNTDKEINQFTKYSTYVLSFILETLKNL